MYYLIIFGFVTFLILGCAAKRKKVYYNPTYPSFNIQKINQKSAKRQFIDALTWVKTSYGSDRYGFIKRTEFQGLKTGNNGKDVIFLFISKGKGIDSVFDFNSYYYVQFRLAGNVRYSASGSGSGTYTLKITGKDVAECEGRLQRKLPYLSWKKEDLYGIYYGTQNRYCYPDGFGKIVFKFEYKQYLEKFTSIIFSAFDVNPEYDPEGLKTYRWVKIDE